MRASAETSSLSAACRRFVLGVAVSLVLAPLVNAQNAPRVTAQVPVGLNPQAIAVNPISNKIYVANTASGTLTVIDGATGKLAFLGVGDLPSAVAVNTATNKIYVADSGGVEVDVIDGTTNAITPLVVGYTPRALAVNPLTNRIYVANSQSDNISVIDGATNVVTNIPVGETPVAVSVNTLTNKIYVANWSSNSVTVINGADNTTASIPAGTNPLSLAVNAVTNTIYVADHGSSEVTEINGNTNTASSVAAGTNPYAVQVNPVSNKVYVANYGGASLSVIDGATNTVSTIDTDVNPASIAINPLSNQIYVAAQSANRLAVIDGATGNISSLVPLAGNGLAVAVNPVTNKIYAANLETNTFNTNNVAIIDGASNSVASPLQPANKYAPPVLVNPSNNKVYFAENDGVEPTLTYIDVLDPAANTFTKVQLPLSQNAEFNYPAQVVKLGLNTATNKVYAIVSSHEVPPECGLAVLNAAGDSVTCVSTGVVNPDGTAGQLAPYGLAIDPVHNRIYLPNQSSVVITEPSESIAVVDGSTDTVIQSVFVNDDSMYNYDSNIAVNPVTNKVYVVSDDYISTGFFQGYDVPSVAVIDGATLQATQVPIVLGDSYSPQPNANLISQPNSIAVNTVTNKIYVASEGNANGVAQSPYDTLSVIDGATNSAHTFSIGPYTRPAFDVYGLPLVAVNPVTNTIYLTSNGNNNMAAPTLGHLAIVYGNNLGRDAITLPTPLISLAVDPSTNKIFTDDGLSLVSIVDGVSETADSISVPFGSTGQVVPRTIAVNPVSNQVWVGGSVITEQANVANPLNTTVSPFVGNTTSDTSPSFTFTTASTFSPYPPPVQAVYYQLDTKQGAWIGASGAAPTFTGTLSAVQPGSHTLFFYATDGSDSTALGIGDNYTGAISAYAFTVVSAN